MSSSLPSLPPSLRRPPLPGQPAYSCFSCPCNWDSTHHTHIHSTRRRPATMGRTSDSMNDGESDGRRRRRRSPAFWHPPISTTPPHAHHTYLFALARGRRAGRGLSGRGRDSVRIVVTHSSCCCFFSSWLLLLLLLLLLWGRGRG